MIEGDTCRFVSRKNHTLAGYQELGSAVAKEVKAWTAILDGELVVADPDDRTVFPSMMQRGRHQVRYFAFDLLWLDGKDLRTLPLLRRKSLLPSRSAHLLYVRHLKGKGRWLYERVCELDLEGIVAKHGASVYQDRRSHDMSKTPTTARGKGGMNGSIVFARTPRLEGRNSDVYTKTSWDPMPISSGSCGRLQRSSPYTF